MKFLSRMGYKAAVLHRLGGVEPKLCLLCGFSGYFRPAGHPPRYDAECPTCGSRERHRLFGLMLRQDASFGRGRVIHFAPEACLGPLLRERADEYRSADPIMPGCDLRLDIGAIDLPSGSVDFFIANHVLEHVDDAKALEEMRRCLVPGGVAAISVPVIEGWKHTYDDPAIAAGGEMLRKLHFGHPDHRRMYGADVRQRIARCGFEVSDFTAGGADCVKYRLTPGQTVFLARKRG
jgi:SAM-dependent methyltransferase